MQWIPLDRDLYVIFLQNCSYETEKDFVSSATAHMACLLQDYFGMGYECVVACRTRLTLMLVMCKASLRQEVHCVFKTLPKLISDWMN